MSDPVPDPEPVPVPAEQAALVLCDELKAAVTDVSVDIANLRKLIALLQSAAGLGYPVGDAVPQLQAKLDSILVEVTAVNGVMQEKKDAIQALANELGDALPPL